MVSQVSANLERRSRSNLLGVEVFIADIVLLADKDRDPDELLGFRHCSLQMPSSRVNILYDLGTGGG